MIRFILRTLLGVPAWLLYFAIMLPLQVIGFPLVAVLALWVQWVSRYDSHDMKGLRHFPKVLGIRLFYLWDNDEDGIDGDPLPEGVTGEPKNPLWFEATTNWSIWRRVFVWSAWRNSVGNARRLPFLGMDMRDPKNAVVRVPPNWIDGKPSGVWPDDYWKEYRKLGPYLARYGWRFELRFPWPQRALTLQAMESQTRVSQRYFWLGWRIAQQDTPNTDIGFAFQPWARL